MISHKQRNTAEFPRGIPCRVIPPRILHKETQQENKTICKEARPHRPSCEYLADSTRKPTRCPQGTRFHYCARWSTFFFFNFAAEGRVKFTKPLSTRARMEPADRTWYTEGRVASISIRFFVSHGLEKHVSQALEEMCLNLTELFHITLFFFTVFVVFLATSHLFLTATRVWAWAAVKLPNFIFVVKLFSTTPVQKEKYTVYEKEKNDVYMKISVFHECLLV